MESHTYNKRFRGGVIVAEKELIIKKNVFHKTEELLYSYNKLKEYLLDETEYIDMINRRTSGSVIKYSKDKPVINEEQRIKDRVNSYELTKLQIERLEKALSKIKNRTGYEVIEYRYLKENPKGGVFSYEEIADILAGQQNYNEDLNEKTVRRYKNILVREIAICLFGVDAI